MVITSIKPSSDYLATPPVCFPAQPTMLHYTAALFSYRGLNGLHQQPHRRLGGDRASPCSARDGLQLRAFNTGGKHLAFWVLSQRFLPPVAIILPIFLLFRTGTLRHAHRPGPGLHAS